MRLPGQIGTELRRPPPTAILPHFHHQHPSAAAPAHLHCQKRLSRCPNANNRWHLPVLPNRTSAHPSTCAAALQLRPGRRERSLPLRFWEWPRDARLWFPRCREATLEKLLPMASGPQGCFNGGQARLGRSGGKVYKCVRARVRAAGGGPWRGCGRGRAVRCLRLSLGLAIFAQRVLPAAGILAPPGYRAPMPRARGGPAPGPRPAARAAALCLVLELGFRLRVGGAAAARSPRAIESGLGARLLRGSAASSVPARGDGRGDVRGALPPAGELAAPSSCGPPPLPPGPSRGRRPQPPPQRRQDSRAPVVMATAAPVNERLSDTRAPALPDVAPGRAAFPLATSSGRRRVGRGVGSRRGTTRDVTSGVDAGSRG